MEDLGRLRIVRSGGSAADVGLMAAIADEADSHAVEEDGADHGVVGKVIAAGDIGIVQDIDIVGRNGLAIAGDDRAHRVAAAAGMNRDAVGLRDDLAVAVAEKAGEIVAHAEDGATRRAHHDPAHLLRDVVELFLDKRQLDDIDCHAVGILSVNSTTKLLARSTVSRSPWPMRTVVVASSISAGPSTEWPGCRSGP